jgi:hypothetical protein
MPADAITISEWIALGCSFFLLHPKNGTKAKFLLLVMVLTVIAESIGYYLRKVVHMDNHAVYIISVPVIVITFLLLYVKNIQSTKYQIIIWISMFVYMIFYIINILWIQGAGKISAYNYVLGAITLIMSVVFYLYEMIKRPVYVSITREPVFWISFGILFLYLPKSILYSVFEYYAYTDGVSTKFHNTRYPINVFLSIIFFGLLSYASLCRLIYRK